MVLGDMIQELRKDKKLDQKDLAKLLNVTIGTISNYENGEHNPSYESIIILADFFDVSVDYLLGHTTLRSSLLKFNKEICNEYTYGDLVNSILNFQLKELQSLIEYVELLKLRK